MCFVTCGTVGVYVSVFVSVFLLLFVALILILILPCRLAGERGPCPASQAAAAEED